jgi:hypothetical protein
MRSTPQPEAVCAPCVGALLGVLAGFAAAVHLAFAPAPEARPFSWPDGLCLMLLGGTAGLAVAALRSFGLGGGAAEDNPDKTSLRRAHGRPFRHLYRKGAAWGTPAKATGWSKASTTTC